MGERFKLHEFPVGGRHAGTVYLFDDLAQSCTAAPPGTFDPMEVYDLGPEIPPSAFAAFATSARF